MSSNAIDFKKYTYEEFGITAQFHRNIDLDDSIVLGSSSVTAVDSAGADATDDVLTAASLTVIDSTVTGTSNALSVTVKGGTVAGSAYSITFKAVTVNGSKFKKVVNMKIRVE